MNKFGVPVSTTGDERVPVIQPKFKNRFRVFFYNFGNQRLSLNGVGGQGVLQTDDTSLALMSNVVSFNKPSVTFAEIPLTSFLGKVKPTEDPLGRIFPSLYVMISKTRRCVSFYVKCICNNKSTCHTQKGLVETSTSI